MKASGKWFLSKAEMARAFQVDVKTINKWVSRDWFPARHRNNAAWNKKAVLAAVEKHNEEEAKRRSGNELSDEKKRLECAKLRVLIKTEKERLAQQMIVTKKMRAEVMEINDVRTTLSEVIGALKGALNNFCQRVGAEGKQAKFLKWAEELRDQVLDDAANRVP